MVTSVCDDVYGLGRIGDWFEKMFGVIGDQTNKATRELRRAAQIVVKSIEENKNPVQGLVEDLSEKGAGRLDKLCKDGNCN